MYNVKEIVENQQQYVFDSSWSRAIPAGRIIREIEEGIVQYETKVLENKEQIFSHLKSVIEKASERSVCSSIGGILSLCLPRCFISGMAVKACS